MIDLRPARLVTAAALVALLTGCAPITITPPRPSPSNVERDDDLGRVEVFEVTGTGRLVPGAGGDAEHVWQVFERVVTPLYAGATILSYRVGDSSDSETLAYVYRDDRRPSLWNLAANLAYADDDTTLLATLVHEYAHLLSLGPREVPPGEVDGCPTLELYEGCANDTSAIYAFQTEFWDAYGADAPDPSSTEWATEFYREHEDEFVSEYAATSVTEDYAETFMTFVLEDRPDDSSGLAAKFAFFYDRPDDVEIRDRIRAEFDL